MSCLESSPAYSTVWLNTGCLHFFHHVAQRREIGNLPNILHGIGGTLYAEGERTFVVENFSYDGLGPAVYVYVYKRGVSVNRFGGGIILRLKCVNT